MDIATKLVSNLLDGRLRAGFTAGFKPEYTTQMRDDHVEFFKQFSEDGKLKSESAVCTPISDTLTIEMLERAYIVAHSMRPAAVYTEHCNFMRINMIRLGTENLPGTHYDSRVGMGMVHCIAWRYHYKLVYGQLQKSELLQYRDESMYAYLPWSVKWDGYSARLLGIQGFVWREGDRDTKTRRKRDRWRDRKRARRNF